MHRKNTELSLETWTSSQASGLRPGEWQWLYGHFVTCLTLVDPADDILAILQVCVCFFLGWFYIKTFCPFCQKVGCWWSPGMDKKVTSPASLGLPRLARLLEGRNGHVLALEHIEERKIISSPETQTQMSENMGKRTAGMFLSSALLGLLQKHLLFLPWMVVVF